MLYVTTRGTQDAFTAYRTMNQDRGPDGGLFVPMRMPQPEQRDVRSLAEQSFGQNVADILNLFFNSFLVFSSGIRSCRAPLITTLIFLLSTPIFIRSSFAACATAITLWLSIFVTALTMHLTATCS